jgi:monovalent cation:H+ antiporter-2, CPA2 family
MEKFLLTIGILTTVISLLILILKSFKQPYLIAYTLAGILLGPHVLRLFEKRHEIELIGEAGIILQMFFLGMELKWPHDSRFMWKPVCFQLMKSVTCILAALAGVYLLNFPLTTAIVLAFILMLNNTSVASEYLKRNHENNTALGTVVLSVLIIQDISFAPLLSSLGFLGGQAISFWKVAPTLFATVLVTLLILRVNKVEQITLPLERLIRRDHDLQLFLGLMLCFGLAILSSSVGLTASLGAFASGILVKKIRAFDWIEHTLHPFRTFFMAIFFVYLGLLFDLEYFKANTSRIFQLLGFLFFFQNLISALCFRLLKYSWRSSIYSGALLSNVGELSLVICLLAFQMKLIDAGILNLVISVAILSILFTTVWTGIIKKFIYPKPFISPTARKLTM